MFFHVGPQTCLHQTCHAQDHVDVLVALSDGQSRILQNLHHPCQELEHDVALATRNAAIQHLHILAKLVKGKKMEKG